MFTISTFSLVKNFTISPAIGDATAPPPPPFSIKTTNEYVWPLKSKKPLKPLKDKSKTYDKELGVEFPSSRFN